MERKEIKEIKENHAGLQEHRPLVSKKHPSATTESYGNPPRPVMPGVKNHDNSDTIHGAKPLKANTFKDRSKIHIKQPSSNRRKEDKSIVCDSTASSRSKKTPKPDKTGRKLDRRKGDLAKIGLEPQLTTKSNKGEGRHISDRNFQVTKSSIQQSRKLDHEAKRESASKKRRGNPQSSSNSDRNSTKIVCSKNKKHLPSTLLGSKPKDSVSNHSTKKRKESSKTVKSQCSSNTCSLETELSNSASNIGTSLKTSPRYPPGIEKTLQVIASKLTKREGLDTSLSPDEKETSSIADLICSPKSIGASNKTPQKKNYTKHQGQQNQFCSKESKEVPKSNRSSKRIRKSEMSSGKHSILHKRLSKENSPEPQRQFSFKDSNTSGSKEQSIIHEEKLSSENLTSQNDLQDKTNGIQPCELHSEENSEIKSTSIAKQGLDDDLPTLVRSRRHSDKQQSQFREETLSKEIENLSQKTRGIINEHDGFVDSSKKNICAKNKEGNTQLDKDNPKILSEDGLDDIENKVINSKLYCEEPRKEKQMVNCKFLNFPIKLQCTTDHSKSSKISKSPKLQKESTDNMETEKVFKDCLYPADAQSTNTSATDEKGDTTNKKEALTTKNSKNLITGEEENLRKVQNWEMNQNQQCDLSKEKPNNCSNNRVNQENNSSHSELQVHQKQASVIELANKVPMEPVTTDSVSTVTAQNLDKNPTNSSIAENTWENLMKPLDKSLNIEIPMALTEVKIEPVSPSECNTDLKDFPQCVDKTYKYPSSNEVTFGVLVKQLKQEPMDTENNENIKDSVQFENPIKQTQDENHIPCLCIKQELSETSENGKNLEITDATEQSFLKEKSSPTEGMLTNVSNTPSTKDPEIKSYYSTEEPNTESTGMNKIIEKCRTDENFNNEETLEKNILHQFVGQDMTCTKDTNEKSRVTKTKISPIRYISEPFMLPQMKNRNTCISSNGSQDIKKPADQPTKNPVSTEIIIPVIRKTKTLGSKRTVTLTDSFLPQISSRCSKGSIKTNEVKKIIKSFKEITVFDPLTETPKEVYKSIPGNSIKSKIIKATPDTIIEATDKNEKQRKHTWSSLHERFSHENQYTSSSRISSDDEYTSKYTSRSYDQHTQRYPGHSRMYQNDCDFGTSPSRSSALKDRESRRSREDWTHQSTSRSWESTKGRSGTPPYISREKARSPITQSTYKSWNSTKGSSGRPAYISEERSRSPIPQSTSKSWESSKSWTKTPPYITRERSRSPIPQSTSKSWKSIKGSSGTPPYISREKSRSPISRSSPSYLASRSPSFRSLHPRSRSTSCRSSSLYRQSMSLYSRSRSHLYRFSQSQYSPSRTMKSPNTKPELPFYSQNYESSSLPSKSRSPYSRPLYCKSQSPYERIGSNRMDTGQLPDKPGILISTSKHGGKTHRPDYFKKDVRHSCLSDKCPDVMKSTEDQDAMGSHTPQKLESFAGQNETAKSVQIVLTQDNTPHKVDLGVTENDELKPSEKHKHKPHQTLDTFNWVMKNPGSKDPEKRKETESLPNTMVNKLEVPLSALTEETVEDNLMENKVDLQTQRNPNMDKPKLLSTSKGKRKSKRGKRKRKSKTNIKIQTFTQRKAENDEKTEQASTIDQKTEKEIPCIKKKIPCITTKVVEDSIPDEDCEFPRFVSKNVDINLKNMTHIYASNGQQVCNSFNMSKFTGIGCPGTCKQLHLSLPLYDHQTNTDLSVSQTENINVLKNKSGFACFYNLSEKMICDDFNSKEGCQNNSCVMAHTSFHKIFSSYYERKLKGMWWSNLVEYQCHSPKSDSHEFTTKSNEVSKATENTEELEKVHEETPGIIPCRYFNTPGGCRRWFCRFAHNAPDHRRLISEPSSQTQITYGKRSLQLKHVGKFISPASRKRKLETTYQRQFKLRRPNKTKEDT